MDKESHSEGNLPSQLRRMVNALISEFESAPEFDHSADEDRRKELLRQAVRGMTGEGVTYGQATGAPSYFNQDHASFRSFIREVDHDLEWQCSTVSDAFRRYYEVGDIPAPHYPMRIAILLRKEKESELERLFLATWCRRFQNGVGVGVTYSKLIERARKVGAISG